VMDDATAAIQTKTDPRDFDPILAEIAQATTANYSNLGGSSFRMADNQQLEAASRFVKQWQSYLMDKSIGHGQAAANDLQMLANGNYSFMPIPRSELLERASKEAGGTTHAVNSAIELHSLDDIPAAISELEVSQRSGGFSMEMNNLMNALQNLESAYLSYQDKNYAVALQQLVNNPFGMSIAAGGGPGLATNDKSSLRQEVDSLKTTLLLEIVQGLLAMPDAPAPEKDELATDYLSRLAALQEKAGDWAGLEQVLEVYQKLAAFNAPAWLAEDLVGLHAYLVGEKLEAAGQTLDAIRCYRQSLATLGKFFPADPPADKLKDLEKKYPELYQQALQQPIARGP
jgi:tetratricopeptide (TPR) repeat protein